MQNNVSGYAGVKAIGKKPDGGFCLIRVRSLLAVWILFKRGDIKLYDLRLYLACFEMQARRCQLEPDRIPEFTEDELLLLVKTGTKSKVRKGLQRLEEVGLLQWQRNAIDTNTSEAESDLEDSDLYLDAILQVRNSHRMVPFPRRMLKFLVKTSNPSLIATAFGHLMRCMYFRNKRCISGGRCKISWVIKVFSLDERNTKSARSRLIELGWLIPCESPQVMMNRWGLQAVINLHWGTSAKVPKSPPLEAQNSSQTPPPIYKELSSKKVNNQKKLKRASGVQNKTEVDSRPNPNHMTLEDLRDPSRLQWFYRKATEAAKAPHSQAQRLRWFAAAEHALAVGKGNPCGLFVTIYRDKLWHHITHDEEDAARSKLKLLDFGEETRLPGQMSGVLPVYDSLAA